MPGVEICGILTAALRMERWALHKTAGGESRTPRGGDAMRITLHIGRFTVTIIVKSRNRRPGR